MTETQRSPMFVSSRPQSSPDSLADVLERVLDKGIVIVGDIQVRLLDIELLTIKVRLMVSSVDKAREMGINWWEGDPFVRNLEEEEKGKDELDLRQRLDALEHSIGGQTEIVEGEASRERR